ncbi:MAG: hypothetical protein AAGK05_16575 [Pseudomonadota bacterium]
MEKVSQVRRALAIQATMDEASNAESDALWKAEPTEIVKKRPERCALVRGVEKSDRRIED